MSVVFFGPQELGNVVRVLVQAASPRPPEETAQQWSEALALISQANAACYRYRYPAHAYEARPLAAEEIRAAMPYSGSLGEAAGTVGLLHYNCQEDRDFLAAVEGGLEALIHVQTALIWAQRDALDRKGR